MRPALATRRLSSWPRTLVQLRSTHAGTCDSEKISSYSAEMKNKLAILMTLVIILILAGVLYTKFGPKPAVTATVVDTSDPYMKGLETDKKILNQSLAGTKQEDNLAYGAMVRLAEIQWPQALESALKLAEHESAYLREGAAQTLGYYDNEKADSKLEVLIQDKDPSVQQSALRALGRSATPARQALISKYQAQQKENSPQTLALLESEYRVKNANKKGEEVLTKIMNLAKSSSDSVANLAALKLIELAPMWPNTVMVMRTKVEEQKDPGVTAAGLRYLAGRRDPWLKDRWQKFATSPNSTIRKALIQSLHRSCPPERENLLVSIARIEIDPTVQDVVISETELLAEPWKDKVYSAMKSNVKDSLVQTRLNDILGHKVEVNPNPPCLQNRAEPAQ